MEKKPRDSLVNGESDSKSRAAVTEIDDLIDNFDVAMLISESLWGELRCRPMAISGHGPGAVLYFLTRADDEKLREILRNSNVAVCMQDEGQYLSVSGNARIETDQVLIDQYWSPTDRLWFPDGPADAATTMIIVEPSYAECWDRTGVRRLEFWWTAGKALASGSKLDDAELSGHHKVEGK